MFVFAESVLNLCCTDCIKGVVLCCFPFSWDNKTDPSVFKHKIEGRSDQCWFNSPLSFPKESTQSLEYKLFQKTAKMCRFFANTLVHYLKVQFLCLSHLFFFFSAQLKWPELMFHHALLFAQEFKFFLTKRCSCLHQLYLQVIRYTWFVCRVKIQIRVVIYYTDIHIFWCISVSSLLACVLQCCPRACPRSWTPRLWFLWRPSSSSCCL